ncbi:unnamed protein product [Arctogadus glacialis]
MTDASDPLHSQLTDSGSHDTPAQPEWEYDPFNVCSPDTVLDRKWLPRRQEGVKPDLRGVLSRPECSEVTS